MLHKAKQYLSNALKSVRNPYFFLGFTLFFLSSISVNIISKTFNLYMQDSHYNKAAVVIVMNLITFPYALKAFIIPLIDAIHIPVISYLGKYKSLILYFYSIVIAAVLALSIISIEHLWITSAISLIGFLFGICIDAMVSGYFNSVSPNDKTWIKGGLMGYNIGMFLAIQAPLFFSSSMNWQLIYSYIAIGLLCFIPVIILLPKCNTSTNNTSDNTTVDSNIATDSSTTLSSYIAPFTDLYSHYKSHFVWLLMTLAFYRAPDRLLGYLLVYVKREILGNNMYQIVTLIASISIFISPLLWSEIKNTHFDRLIFINKIYTITILLFGATVAIWYKTHSLVALYSMIIVFIILKFIRLLESSSWFAYHCDLTTNTKYFQSQLAIFSSAEQGCAKITTLLLYPLLSYFGNTYIFFIIAFTSFPAILGLNKMKQYQELLTRELSK